MQRELSFVRGKTFAVLTVVVIAVSAGIVAYLAPRASVPAWAVVGYIVASGFAAVVLPVGNFDPYDRRCSGCGRPPEPPALLVMIMTPMIAATVLAIAVVIGVVSILIVGAVGLGLGRMKLWP
jgi:hypothetical protein